MRKGSEKPQRMVARKWMSKMALKRLQGPIKQNKVEEQRSNAHWKTSKSTKLH